MGNLVQPPTYAPLTVEGPDGAQNAINPVWLQWFLQYGTAGSQSNSAVVNGAYVDVTSYRTLGGNYSNPFQRSMLLVVSAQVPTGGTLQISANNPTMNRSLFAVPNTSSSTQSIVGSGRVPIGWQYSANVIGATGTLNYWMEW